MNLLNVFRGEFEVTVKGKKVKGAVTMNALRLVVRNEKVKLEEFDKYLGDDPLTAVPTIGYYACISEALKSGKELKLNKEMFIGEVLDNGGFEAIAEAITNAINGGEEEGSGND